MDAQIKDLKTSLRLIINQFLHDKSYSNLKDRCLDAINYLSVFKTSVQSAQHREDLIMKYQNLKTILERGRIEDFEMCISDLIYSAAFSITLPLNPVRDYPQICIQKSQENNYIHLSKIIGYVIGCSMYQPIISKNDFNTCWELTLENTL